MSGVNENVFAALGPYVRWSMTLLFSAPKQCSLCELRGPSASSQHLAKCLYVIRLCQELQEGKLLRSSQFLSANGDLSTTISTPGADRFRLEMHLSDVDISVF